MRLTYILPLFMLFSIIACKKPSESHVAGVWAEYSHPTISLALLRDTLPDRFISSLHIKELHGVKMKYATGKFTMYYEYDAEPKAILKMISALPFKMNNARSDTTCRVFDTPFSTRAKKFLSHEELEAANFFWKINPEDFLYYECLKSPARHTILINKATGRILHRIESINS